MYDGNTGVIENGKPIPRVIPDLDMCPVCGEWLTFLNKDGTRCESNNAQAEATCTHDNSGALSGGLLFWTCKRCGARWLHGQFAGKGAA